MFVPANMGIMRINTILLVIEEFCPKLYKQITLPGLVYVGLHNCAKIKSIAVMCKNNQDKYIKIFLSSGITTQRVGLDYQPIGRITYICGEKCGYTLHDRFEWIMKYLKKCRYIYAVEIKY